jgi:hypothetical protein
MALADSHGNARQSAMTRRQSARLEPSHVVAAASGSGVVLTWIAPPGQPPLRYAISGGTAVHEANLPVVVTPDASTQYTIPALPPGTYHFTVSAITSDSLSAPSSEAAVVVSGSALASPAPSGAQVDADAPHVTATWTPAPLAGTLYQVEIGEEPGLASGVLTTIEPSITFRPDAPPHYFRVRAVRGAMISAPSNEVFVSGAPPRCAAPPAPPILLPVSTTDGETTTSWLPGRGPLATHYRVDGLGPDGRMTLASHRSGTSLTATLEAGAYTLHVIAINECGESATSNSVSFRQPVHGRR